MFFHVFFGRSFFCLGGVMCDVFLGEGLKNSLTIHEHSLSSALQPYAGARSL